MTSFMSAGSQSTSWADALRINLTNSMRAFFDSSNPEEPYEDERSILTFLSRMLACEITTPLQINSRYCSLVSEEACQRINLSILTVHATEWSATVSGELIGVQKSHPIESILVVAPHPVHGVSICQ